MRSFVPDDDHPYNRYARGHITQPYIGPSIADVAPSEPSPDSKLTPVPDRPRRTSERAGYRGNGGPPRRDFNKPLSKDAEPNEIRLKVNQIMDRQFVASKNTPHWKMKVSRRKVKAYVKSSQQSY